MDADDKFCGRCRHGRLADSCDKCEALASAVNPLIVCRYCGKSDKSWTKEDLKAGRRNIVGGVEYHCYAGYCSD